MTHDAQLNLFRNMILVLKFYDTMFYVLLVWILFLIPDVSFQSFFSLFCLYPDVSVHVF